MWCEPMRDLTTTELLTLRNGLEAVHLLLRLAEEETNALKAKAGELTDPKLHEDRRNTEFADVCRQRKTIDGASDLLRAVLDQAGRAPFDG